VSRGPRAEWLATATAAAAAVKAINYDHLLCRWLALCALLMAASCDTPIGVSPALQGTYLQHALVTNPDGSGPQVVRWGPPGGGFGGGGGG